jgi:hypothetical protein
MALKALSKTGGTPSAQVVSDIAAEEKIAAVRAAHYSYEKKRADLQQKFEAALSALRDEYLAEVAEITAANGA